MKEVEGPVDHARIVHHDGGVPIYGFYEDESSRELPQVPEIARSLNSSLGIFLTSTCYVFNFGDVHPQQQLDAHGGHFGVTPDSNGSKVYHYHMPLIVSSLHFAARNGKKFGVEGVPRSIMHALTPQGTNICHTHFHIANSSQNIFPAPRDPERQT